MTIILITSGLVSLPALLSHWEYYVSCFGSLEFADPRNEPTRHMTMVAGLARCTSHTII